MDAITSHIDPAILEAAKKSTGEAIAAAKDSEIEALVDSVKDDKTVDPEKLAELDMAMTEEQKQIIMQQFINDILRKKRRSSQATKKKVAPSVKKKKRQAAKAARKKNR